MISPQYNNSSIAKFVLAVPLKIKKTNRVYNFERLSLLLTGI